MSWRHLAWPRCMRQLAAPATSASTDGSVGELLATALQRRGVRGLVTTGGVRDVAELHAMNFPVFCAAVSAQGTVKATAGAGNLPIRIARQRVPPRQAGPARDHRGAGGQKPPAA